jgi:hypothetical protein
MMALVLAMAMADPRAAELLTKAGERLFGMEGFSVRIRVESLDRGAGAAVREGRRVARYDWIKLDAPEREDVFAARPPAGYRRVPDR